MRVVSSCSTCRTRKKRLLCDAPFVRKLSDITTYNLRPVPATTSPSDTSQPPDNSGLGPENTHPAAQSDSTLDIVQATLEDQTLCEELINIYFKAIQGCVLLGFYACTDGDTARDDLLSCQAIRMSQTLEIPTTLNANGLKREIEINVYWQTWMMDRWSSVRSDWPLQLRNDTNLPRPLRQEVFDLLTPEGTPCDLSSSNELRESSMWGLILPLTQWHAEVVKLNFQIATEASLGHEIHDVVQDLSTQLSNWAQSLPFHLRDTPQNFRDYSSRGYGRLFSVMHIIYHNTCQSLFYQFLAKSLSRERGVTADHMVLTCAELCRSHAVSLSKLYWELNTASDLDCLWSPVNSHLLVIASTIHLHMMLLQPEKVEATEARQLLEKNFIILQELQKYWPTTEFAFSRLQAFHNACRVSSISKTFNMYKWMANFLNRYDVSVQDRDLDMELADLGASNNGDELWEILFGGD
ncbi:C6 transcription factor [Fusarium circinatum]|uniref:C6 transcription factor n=1 Tax=Fusarium circinatum TaxID=48490 RepID=A0A8H5X1K5_FUSCI|nr:C6 transcription factor [Fusarium circinatum]